MKGENYLTSLLDTYVPAQSSSTSAISSTSASSTSRFPSHSSVPAASASPSAECMKENVQPAVPISSNQVSSSVNVAEFTGMPSSMYSMAIKQNLSAPFQIFNSCVFNTNNLRESPRREWPRKRRIIIDSDSD